MGLSRWWEGLLVQVSLREMLVIEKIYRELVMKKNDFRTLKTSQKRTGV